MRPEHWLFTIPLRLRSLFRRAQADRELDEELGVLRPSIANEIFAELASSDA